MFNLALSEPKATYGLLTPVAYINVSLQLPEELSFKYVAKQINKYGIPSKD